MRLFEHEGKMLFRKSGIRVPSGSVIDASSDIRSLDDGVWPKLVKAQLLKGGRGKAGAITETNSLSEARHAMGKLLGRSIGTETVKSVLVEEKVAVSHEYYLCLTYKNDLPVVVFSKRGGINVEELSKKKPSYVIAEPVDITNGLDSAQAHHILSKAKIREDIEELTDVMLKLYKCFYNNDAHLAEINPLVRTESGRYVACDSKIELDDEARFRQTTLTLPERRDFSRKTTELEMEALRNDQMDTRGAAGRMFYEIPSGDIIVLASGGGTSSEALDSLFLHGGHPAVFTEYSGNPTSDKVRGLTRISLEYPGEINGIWVVGGRANFTDIYETLVNGIIAGVRDTHSFDRRIPIVIRRAGLRDMEAFDALRHIRKNEGFNIFLRGMETSISDSAQLLIHHVNNYRKTVRGQRNGHAHKQG